VNGVRWDGRRVLGFGCYGVALIRYCFFVFRLLNDESIGNFCRLIILQSMLKAD